MGLGGFGYLGFGDFAYLTGFGYLSFRGVVFGFVYFFGFFLDLNLVCLFGLQ